MRHTEKIGKMFDLEGARVLITGGTGTFGQRMVRELLRMPEGPECVVILSRDEWKQSRMQAERPDEPRLRYFLGDVRDRQRLHQAFRGVDVVIHAAALKQVPAAEYNPSEAVQTNIDGALNVIDAAINTGVKRVVALSTDKACEPVNLYGATKAVAEKLFLAAGAYVGALGEPKFAVTRYGNVTGSRGSVLEVWREAIAAGRPITITHPACTRFWMTPAEAVQLVLWTIERMEGGELVVPDLPAYRVQELAGALYMQTGQTGHPQWKVVGLRQGEKMHESMISRHEAAQFSPYSTRDEGGTYWVKDPNNPPGQTRLQPLESDTAQRLTMAQLELLIDRERLDE